MRVASERDQVDGEQHERRPHAREEHPLEGEHLLKALAAVAEQAREGAADDRSDDARGDVGERATEPPALGTTVPLSSLP